MALFASFPGSNRTVGALYIMRLGFKSTFRFTVRLWVHSRQVGLVHTNPNRARIFGGGPDFCPPALCIQDIRQFYRLDYKYSLLQSRRLIYATLLASCARLRTYKHGCRGGHRSCLDFVITTP